MKFSTGSLNTYKGRFQKSFNMFKEFRTSPATWRPNVRQRSRSTSKADESAGKPGPAAVVSEGKTTPGMTAPMTHRATIITYPFPIRDGVLASIELPADLTRREARRLAAFVDSLAVDDSPAGPNPVVADEED